MKDRQHLGVTDGWSFKEQKGSVEKALLSQSSANLGQQLEESDLLGARRKTKAMETVRQVAGCVRCNRHDHKEIFQKYDCQFLLLTFIGQIGVKISLVSHTEG